MKELNMRTLAEKALHQMELDGASASKLRKYRETAFGSIIKHSEEIGRPEFSELTIDRFVAHLRDEYERGESSKWKWQLIRRGGELLKHFKANATLDLSRCTSWEVLHNPLRRNPTQDEMKIENNIFSLIWRTKQEMLKFELSPYAMRSYLYNGFDRILSNHIENGITTYSPKLVVQLTDAARKEYKNNSLNRSSYNCLCKIAALLNEFYETGTLVWRHLPEYGAREPHDFFAELMFRFCCDDKIKSTLASRTIKQSKGTIRIFLLGLEDSGIYSFDNITHRIISEQANSLVRNCSGGIHTILYRLRLFLKFLHSNGITKHDLSVAIPEKAAPRKKVHEGFSDDDIDKFFAQIDSTTPIGKRDYAIMMLALQTGLRSSDIVNLKRKDINWSKNEIRIVQVKTNRILSLHLPVECGNAIADYILNSRPECDIGNIFLCSTRPFRPIQNSSSMGSIFSRYMKKAGIKGANNKRTGMHDFRRTFGKNLLESETSLDMFSELLGHSDMESSKPYISIDEFGLKKCALNLVSSALDEDADIAPLKPIALDEYALMKCALGLVDTAKVGDEVRW